MIDRALDALRQVVAGFLLRLPELNVTSDSVVVLSPLVKPDGSVAIPENSLALTLVCLEEERVLRAQAAVSTDLNGRVSHRNPEVKLNLYVMVTSHFKNYKTALEFLSAAVRLFQSRNVFTPGDIPALEGVAEKLVVELHSLDFEQQNHLWASLGAKYMPSVMYKVRMLTIQESQKSDEQEPVMTINFSDRSIWGR